jgi:hypothetical protein
MKTAIALLALFGFFIDAVSVQSAEVVIGTYSNLYYNEEGGDLLGLEIIIRHNEHG